jgi:bifunctional non-homologous end joining protein LigD
VGYAELEGSWKYFGALLVDFYESKKLLLAELELDLAKKRLHTFFTELNLIRIDRCPFYNLPATGRSRWDQGLTAAEMKRCH